MSAAPPLHSPDGRFVLEVIETQDRHDTLVATVLTERASGRRLFQCPGAPPARFLDDGTLALAYERYGAQGVRVDPVRAQFRLREDGPWLPLSGWPLLEQAWHQGWAEAMDFRGERGDKALPWLELGVAGVALALLPALALLLRGELRIVFLLIDAAVLLLFGWLATGSLRLRAQLKRRSRP